MANFYVLPPRAVLERQLRRIVEAHLPGLPVEEGRLLELFHNQASAENCILHREDLPEGIEGAVALRDLFGAEDGDTLVQISGGTSLDTPRVTRLNALKMPA